MNLKSDLSNLKKICSDQPVNICRNKHINYNHLTVYIFFTLFVGMFVLGMDLSNNYNIEL